MKSDHTVARIVRRQSGIVLLIALIALVAISLAGVALMRSVDTGLVVSGNLAFRQTSVQIADAGTEQAVTWLTSNSASLDNDVKAAGYYASRMDLCDLTGETPSTDDDAVWDPNGTAQSGCNMLAVAVGSESLVDGYMASFVIHRMCDSSGSPNAIQCSRLQGQAGSDSSSTKTGGSYGATPLSGPSQIYYRITTRVDGPRNTSAMIQTVIAL